MGENEKHLLDEQLKVLTLELEHINFKISYLKDLLQKENAKLFKFSIISLYHELIENKKDILNNLYIVKQNLGLPVDSLVIEENQIIQDEDTDDFNKEIFVSDNLLINKGNVEGVNFLELLENEINSLENDEEFNLNLSDIKEIKNDLIYSSDEELEVLKESLTYENLDNKVEFEIDDINNNNEDDIELFEKLKKDWKNENDNLTLRLENLIEEKKFKDNSQAHSDLISNQVLNEDIVFDEEFERLFEELLNEDLYPYEDDSIVIEIDEDFSEMTVDANIIEKDFSDNMINTNIIEEALLLKVDIENIEEDFVDFDLSDGFVVLESEWKFNETFELLESQYKIEVEEKDGDIINIIKNYNVV